MKKADQRLAGFVHFQLRGQDLNLRPRGYAYHYGFHRLAYLSLKSKQVCSLDFTLTLDRIVRVPTIKSLHLPDRNQAWLGIATAGGFPEFDR